MRFVSVSAVTEIEDISKIAEVADEIALPVVIGYQVSHKSINQGTKNGRQPYFKDLRRLDVVTRLYGMNTAVHYYTKDNATILDDLALITEQVVQPSLLQFNTLPPSRETLQRTKEMGFSPIFKVAVAREGGYAVWQDVHDVSNPETDPLVQQVLDRHDVIDYVMFDPSHGTGHGLDLSEDSLAVRFGRAITRQHELDRLGLVYAGGIGPENVGQATRILATLFPGRISIDSESGVRTDDKLDMKKVEAYLKNCES